MFDIFRQFRELVFSKTAKDTSTVFTGNAASSALAIVFSILAARSLGPENWGIAAAVISFTSIVIALGDLGLSAGLFRFASRLWQKNRHEAEKILKTIFSLRILTALFLTLLVAGFSSRLSSVLKFENPVFLVLGALGILGSLLLELQIATFESKQHWKRAAVFIASANSVRLALLLVFLSLGTFNIFYALLAFYLGALVAFGLSVFWQRVGVGFEKDWRAVLKEVLPFSSWMGVNRILGAVNSRLDVLLLLQLATPYDAGIYAAARQLSNGVPIILGSFATVLAPKFAIFEADARRAFFKKSTLLAVVISAGILLGVLFAKPIIGLFGRRFLDSVSVLQWLLVAMVPFALATPAVNALVYAFHKPRIIATLSFLQLPLIFFGNIFLIPRMGVFGPVAVLGIWNLSTLIIAFFISLAYFSRSK